MALALAFESTSLYIESHLGKMLLFVTFCIFYLSVLLCVITDIYYYNAIKVSPFGVIKQSLRTGRDHLYTTRFVLAVLMVILNAVLMVFFFVKGLLKPGPQSLSAPILVICGTNVSVFLCSYMTLKLQENWVNKQENRLELFLRYSSYAFLCSALGLGVVASIFYTRSVLPPDTWSTS